MFVWRQWNKVSCGKLIKRYKALLLLGFIPLYVYVDG